MSGEQKATKTSHMTTRQPYLPADDEVVSVPELTLEQLQRQMMGGFMEVHRAMGEHTTLIRREMVQLRDDLTPRVAAVEQKTSTLGTKAKVAAGWTGVASLALTLAAQIASMYRPSMVGPIEAIAQMFGGP